MNHRLVNTAIHSLPRKDSLTNRQCGIAIEFANGRNIKEIALSMGIDEKTVEYHKANIVKVLDIKVEPYSAICKHIIKLGYITV